MSNSNEERVYSEAEIAEKLAQELPHWYYENGWIRRKYRTSGWESDKANEAELPPLPFAQVDAPTLIAHGANDAIVPLGHATNAAECIDTAELIVVEEGHHLLALSRNYGTVARRQLELAAAA